MALPAIAAVGNACLLARRLNMDAYGNIHNDPQPVIINIPNSRCSTSQVELATCSKAM